VEFTPVEPFKPALPSDVFQVCGDFVVVDRGSANQANFGLHELHSRTPVVRVGQNLYSVRTGSGEGPSPEKAKPSSAVCVTSMSRAEAPGMRTQTSSLPKALKRATSPYAPVSR